MEIVVNTRLLISGKLEGIGTFAHETLKRITLTYPQHTFTFLFDRPYSSEFIYGPNVKGVILSPPARHPVLWAIWFEYSVAGYLKKKQPDLFLSPDGWIPLRSNTPSLTVIHDLNFVHHPEFIPFFPKKYYEFFFPRYARKATRIATVSEYTKADIVKTYGIAPDKIDVVYNGTGNHFVPIPEGEQHKIRKELTGGYPYFLNIGLIHPRKNLQGLFRAYNLFRKKESKVYKLVIVGETKWWTKEIKDAYDALEFQEDVIFTGRAKKEDLVKYLGSAYALTYVSFFEGFGIPLLEAMECEVPVIASNVTSLPEVGQDAVVYCDPRSAESIAEAMLKLTTDEKYRLTLIEAGKVRRSAFSWEKTAELLWKSIENSLKK